MASRFRLACKLSLYGGTERPPKPDWLLDEAHATRNQAHSHNYWTKIYWATPPWLAKEHINEMREIYLTAPEGTHVDHIVPLKSPIVCGLHVPWNLEQIPDKRNLHKSNHHWPGHPLENEELFDLNPPPHQMRLAI